MSQQLAGGLPETLRDLHTGVALYQPGTGRILDANDRLLSLYGYPLEQLRTMSIDQYSANTSALSEADVMRHIRTAAEGTPQQFRWRIKRADGDLRWVQASLSPIELADRRYVLAEITDVTRSINDNRRVRLLTRILRHNLRNDTNVVSGYAEEIRETADGEQVREYAECINETALELGRLSQSVGQIERVVSGDYGEQSRTRVRTVVEAVVSEVESGTAGVSFTVDELVEMWVDVDDAFTVALTHAIDNAVRHNSGGDQRVTVAIDASPNTGRAEIRIGDNGPQIPDMEVDALDESNAYSGTAHGSGVGLFVMKWCIESLGGELRIERHADENVVHFYLPRKSPPAQ